MDNAISSWDNFLFLFSLHVSLFRGMLEGDVRGMLEGDVIVSGGRWLGKFIDAHIGSEVLTAGIEVLTADSEVLTAGVVTIRGQTPRGLSQEIFVSGERAFIYATKSLRTTGAPRRIAKQWTQVYSYVRESNILSLQKNKKKKLI